MCPIKPLALPARGSRILSAGARSLDFTIRKRYSMNMELIERLETRFDELILRVRQLEEDNLALMAQVEAEAGKRQEVQDRIEALLVKVQASLGGQ